MTLGSRQSESLSRLQTSFKASAMTDKQPHNRFAAREQEPSSDGWSSCGLILVLVIVRQNRLRRGEKYNDQGKET